MRLHLDAAGALGGSSHVMERHLRERGVRLKWFNRWNWRHPLRYYRRNTRTCRHRIRCLYSDAFAGARERIFLTTPYFVPDLLTQQRLIRAARRGIDVRLLVPSKSDVPITRWAAQAYYDVLMIAGMRIYEYQPRMLHAKTAVIDGDWAAVGTANLDYRSFFLNYELVLASGEPGFCSQLEQHFLNDLTESLPITSLNWQRRRWPGRMLEEFGWIMRRWL